MSGNTVYYCESELSPKVLVKATSFVRAAKSYLNYHLKNYKIYDLNVTVTNPYLTKEKQKVIHLMKVENSWVGKLLRKRGEPLDFKDIEIMEELKRCHVQV